MINKNSAARNFQMGFIFFIKLKKDKLPLSI